MRTLGIDLAWGDKNETGVLALDPDGTVADAGWAIGVAATVEWIQRWATADTLVMIDAPLVVENASGQRACETECGQRYWRSKVACNSTNVKKKDLAGISMRVTLESHGFRYDSGVDGPPIGGRLMSECYPYTALVGVEELGYDERPTYKRKPKSVSSAAFRPLRAAVCDDLINRLEREHPVSLQLSSHSATRELLDKPSPLTDREYKHREDLIDAAVCAWTGQLWVKFGFDRCQVLGEQRHGAATIIAPARAAQRG